MIFRLRYLQHNLELLPGEFLIGRSAECQLSLDDPLVSRRHALLTVTSETVVVADLGSRNGVLVNRIKIDGPRSLADGDCISIGSQDMSLMVAIPSRPDALAARRRAGTQTLSSMVSLDAHDGVPRQESKRIDALSLLGSVADKALVLGRHEEAERILAPVLNDILIALRSADHIPADMVDQAGRYAVRLAASTNKETWIDYLVETYTWARRPWPASIIDELHNVLRKAKSVDVAAFKAYVQVLRDGAASYGPSERFLVQRIEGLERLALLR